MLRKTLSCSWLISCFTLEFNFCHSSPCKNGGTCTPNTDSFHCDCKQGFFGNTCEGKKLVVTVTTLLEKHLVNQYFIMPFNFTAVSSNCFPNPCKNDGLCAEVKNKEGYMCICKGGYAGRHCESKLCDWLNIRATFTANQGFPCLALPSCSWHAFGLFVSCVCGYCFSSQCFKKQ